MNKKKVSKLLKALRMVEESVVLRGYVIIFGSKSFDYIPDVGVFTCVHLDVLSRIASQCGLHYYVTSREGSACFIMYIPSKSIYE